MSGTGNGRNDRGTQRAVREGIRENEGARENNQRRNGEKGKGKKVRKQSRMLREEVKLFKEELDLKKTTRRMEMKAIFYRVSDLEIQENRKEDRENIEKTIKNICVWRRRGLNIIIKDGKWKSERRKREELLGEDRGGYRS